MLLRTIHLATLVAACLLLAAPSHAQTAVPADRSAQREALFEALAAARSEPDARTIEEKIWDFWFKAPDQDTQLLLDASRVAQVQLNYRGALTALATLIERAPHYAEGWNQRAIVLFLMGAHDESLEAIERTLALEPKHFGALAGKGLILLMQGKDELAQAAFKEAVKINPWLKERNLISDGPGRRI